MDSFFQTVMYFIFGKRWLLLGMKHGYKTSIFVNHLEAEMAKLKIKKAKENRVMMERELADLEATPLKDAMSELPEEDRTNAKKLFDLEQAIKEERAQAIQGLKNRIKSLSQEEQLADGELQRIYSIEYSNRLKYDFVRNYKIQTTYADLNK